LSNCRTKYPRILADQSAASVPRTDEDVTWSCHKNRRNLLLDINVVPKNDLAVLNVVGSQNQSSFAFSDSIARLIGEANEWDAEVPQFLDFPVRGYVASVLT